MPKTDDELAAAAADMPAIPDDHDHNVGQDLAELEDRQPVELPYDPAADDEDEEIG
ncbi:hypothetical protein ACGF7U_31460 [Micromonospora sp. NPDC047670]|uniref:hypothetical protein n=1 Tax=Micromonospora sp. NPDC047670 TaxID=3364252 RepID=UPI00371CD8C4